MAKRRASQMGGPSKAMFGLVLKDPHVGKSKRVTAGSSRGDCVYGQNAFQTPSIGRCLGLVPPEGGFGEDPELSGEINSLGSLRKTPVSPQKNRRRWLRRGMSWMDG